MRDGDETRVAHVFDFGPPFGIRPRAGDFIELVPPFGASFVAWDDADGRRGLAEPGRAPARAPHERDRYLGALAAVRRRGYSITVASDRQADLAVAFERLSLANPTSTSVRARGTRRSARSPTATTSPPRSTPRARPGSPRSRHRCSSPGGRAAASIMLLGPDHELTADQITGLGQLVREAADRATVRRRRNVPLTATG